MSATPLPVSIALAGHTKARRARNVSATSRTAHVRIAARICGTLTWKPEPDLPEDVDRDDDGGDVQPRIAGVRQDHGIRGPAERQCPAGHISPRSALVGRREPRTARAAPDERRRVPAVDGSASSLPSGLHGVASPAPRSMTANVPASTVIHGPISPSGHCTRTSACVGVAEADVDPAELPAGVAAADRDLLDRRAVADARLHPRADGVDVGRRLAQPDGDPRAHRLGPLGIAAADVAPQRRRARRG